MLRVGWLCCSCLRFLSYGFLIVLAWIIIIICYFIGICLLLLVLMGLDFCLVWCLVMCLNVCVNFRYWWGYGLLLVGGFYFG